MLFAIGLGGYLALRYPQVCDNCSQQQYVSAHNAIGGHMAIN